jgi:glutamate-1-semialdehyde 2,1-aminomutase
MVPCAELVRFGSSGSEMIHAALCLARAATGRNVIVKFEGHYHGWLDNILWSHAPTLDEAGPGDRPRLVPGSAGQEPDAGSSVAVLQWNDAAAVKERLAIGDVAAVIMEPVMCNTSAIWPLDGYLEEVRAACDAAGTLLIFDEVITGFRLAPGGAQQVLGVSPDLAVFGKAIANGFPVACLAGRRDLLEMLGGRGKVLHGGTYSGQPVAMAATLATLRSLLDGTVHDRITQAGERLKAGIREAIASHDQPGTVQGPPSAFHVSFGVEGPVTNYRQALQADRPRYVAFTTELLAHGIRALERGIWFLSAAHDETHLDETLEAVDRALRSLP